uniref:Pep3/Vps18 RING C-terminal domain-containing protein n=1 Tax=Tetraselmis chuii TaxID=63592 RepID=A0A7S1SRU6_9CHLO|mmetsp:Transcript_25701/g.45755  ORF Transcript_25701/g.45755 Transcript_25701/m.45755 type:complete len:656 (+) Transcript_25701:343-2310(+)
MVGSAARGLAGTPMGLSIDTASSTILMYTGEALHEVSVRHESRDMWRIYLARAEYEQAAAHCDSVDQKNVVWTEQAEAAFNNADYMQAARLFARLDTMKPTFEQVALRFVDIGNPAALHEFLICKLEALTADDRAQATMVATWLTELQLDQINRALLNDEGEGGAECQGLIDQLRSFLTQYRDVLDETTTSALLASYGRLDELLHFAAMHDDNETVIEHLMQRGEVARALGVLRRPNVSLELVYKFAPVLIVAAPTDTVDAWIHTGSNLDTRRLMPALLRCDEPATTTLCRNEALRYIEFCIHHLHSDDAALHNLAISLYSAKDDEADLLAYLKQAKGPLGTPYYDAKFALRLARERNRQHACVQLLSDMGMYQDATALAIKVDVELAKQVAELPEDDAPLRRKLWLTIARHLVESHTEEGDQRHRIRQAVNFLKETNGLLKIEDILPFFPDFVLIDEFKDAICSSLEEYNRQIEDLKTEMDVATEIADVLRKDLTALEQRAMVVDLDSPCERCGRSLAAGGPPTAKGAAVGALTTATAATPGAPAPLGAIPPFYVFPCNSSFHSTCLLEEVKDLHGAAKREVISSLASRMMALEPTAATAPATGKQPAEAVLTLRRQLDDLIAAECPRCGESVIKLIDKPLVEPGDAEVASWAI